MAWKRNTHKFGAVASTTLCSYGFSHRSKLERSVCDTLRLRELAGELKVKRHEVRLFLTPAKIEYRADFECLDVKKDCLFYCEAKGYETPEWRLKKRLWPWYRTEILEIWGGAWTRPTLLETIHPKV